jgi:TIR domain
LRCPGGRAVQVFLSYRRGDVGGYAGRLADGLRQRLGANSVFQDVTAIAPGQDYTAAIDQALDGCDAVLVVIGRGWLAAATPQGTPRLFQADDYVRLELSRALNRMIPVIPVLVGGAALPAAGELPDDLQGLVHRQAVVLHDETWHQDVEGLLRSLRGQPTVPARPWRRWLVPAGVAIALIALVGVGAAAGWWGPGRAGGSGTGDQTGSRPESCPARRRRARAGVRSRSTTTPPARRDSRMVHWSSR